MLVFVTELVCADAKDVEEDEDDDTEKNQS